MTELVSPTDSSSEVVPRSFGNWYVEEELGQGAQAVTYIVYRGVARAERRALKALKPWTAESKQTSPDEQRRRFFTEVSTLQTAQQGGCPRIVEVIDAQLDWRSGEPLWYVMPYYEGGAMLSPAKAGGVPTYAEHYRGAVNRVLSIAADLAETVEWLHASSQPVIHRDIHTQNVFFETRGGRPILGDFGLAAVGTHDSGGGTRLSEGFGPWRWRPPEVRAGNENKREFASDIYMIGGVVYEALSGGKHVEETQDLSGAFIHEKGEYHLSNFVSDARARQVSEMLRRCFYRDPRMRFSATELRRACHELLSWRAGAPPTDFGEHRVRIRAAEDSARRRSSLNWQRTQFDEIRTMLGVIVEELQQIYPDVNQEPMDYRITTSVSLGSYSKQSEAARDKITADAPEGSRVAVDVISVFVQFRPEPNVSWNSDILVWRDTTGQHIAGVGQDGSLQALSSSFVGDPSHPRLVRDSVNEEIVRLQKLACSALEA